MKINSIFPSFSVMENATYFQPVLSITALQSRKHSSFFFLENIQSFESFLFIQRQFINSYLLQIFLIPVFSQDLLFMHPFLHSFWIFQEFKMARFTSLSAISDPTSNIIQLLKESKFENSQTHYITPTLLFNAEKTVEF